MSSCPSRQVFRVTPSYVAEQRNPVSTRHSFACVTSNPAASNHTTKPQVADGVGVYPPPTPKARPLGIVPFSLGRCKDVSHRQPARRSRRSSASEAGRIWEARTPEPTLVGLVCPTWPQALVGLPGAARQPPQSSFSASWASRIWEARMCFVKPC